MRAKWLQLRQKIYQKRRVILIWGVILAVFLAVFGRNFYTIFSLEQQKADLVQQLEEEQDRSSTLNVQLQSIGSREYIEKIAREKYNLFYSNEMIVTPEYEE